jgi:hypothetical protein
LANFDVQHLDGDGLGLQECLELRVKDLDLAHRQIVIRRGKGQKDHLPCCRLLSSSSWLTLSSQSSGNTSTIWREGSGAWWCRSRSTANARTPLPSGMAVHVSGVGCVPIRDGDHQGGTHSRRTSGMA